MKFEHCLRKTNRLYIDYNDNISTNRSTVKLSLQRRQSCKSLLKSLEQGETKVFCIIILKQWIELKVCSNWLLKL